MSQASTNPDLGPDYLSFHRQVIKKYQQLLNTEATAFIMLGEAMVGPGGGSGLPGRTWRPGPGPIE